MLPHCLLSFHFIIIIIIYTFLQYFVPFMKIPVTRFYLIHDSEIFFRRVNFSHSNFIDKLFRGRAGEAKIPGISSCEMRFKSFYEVREARSNQTLNSRRENASQMDRNSSRFSGDFRIGAEWLCSQQHPQQDCNARQKKISEFLPFSHFYRHGRVAGKRGKTVELVPRDNPSEKL